MITLEKEMLQLYLELHSLSPNQEKWSKEAFKDNPPRLYRYINLCAIAKALGIYTIYFSGDKWLSDFIDKKQMTRWHEIETLARKNFNCKLGYIRKPDKPNILILRDMFRYLIDVALNYQRNITAKKQIILSSGYGYLNLEILEDISQKNKQHLKEVEEILGLLINPKCIVCPKSILIDEFGYQDIDFGDLDLEWI